MKNENLWRGEVGVGRIPECLQRMYLGDSLIAELLQLLNSDGISFKSQAHIPYAWKGIQSQDGGEPRDEDESFLIDYMQKHHIDTLYATSHVELKKAHKGTVLLAQINNPTIYDLCDLRVGAWCTYELKEQGLLWDSWREQLWFTLPLQFSMVRLKEGYGYTTIIGPAELTEGLKAIPPSEEFPHDPPWEDWPIKET